MSHLTHRLLFACLFVLTLAATTSPSLTAPILNVPSLSVPELPNPPEPESEPVANVCFEGDCESGQGKSTVEGIGKYDGAWEHGKYNGHGLFTFKNGAFYSGNWVNDEAHGECYI